MLTIEAIRERKVRDKNAAKRFAIAGFAFSLIGSLILFAPVAASLKALLIWACVLCALLCFGRVSTIGRGRESNLLGRLSESMQADFENCTNHSTTGSSSCPTL